MSNFRSKHKEPVTSFPHYAEAVTTSDVTVFDQPNTVYVGGDGDVAVVPWGQTSPVTFVGLIAGAVVPVLVRQVMATNTTATDLVRVYNQE